MSYVRLALMIYGFMSIVLALVVECVYELGGVPNVGRVFFNLAIGATCFLALIAIRESR